MASFSQLLSGLGIFQRWNQDDNGSYVAPTQIDNLLAGEDEVQNRQLVGKGWHATRILGPTGAAGTLILPRPGTFGGLVLNTPQPQATITIYDGLTVATATNQGTVVLPSTLLQQGPVHALYEFDVNVGLLVVTTVANLDITVLWR